MKSFFFNIDILGAGGCNLTCPSCPVGNAREIPNPRGMMSPDVLREILEKASRECEIAGVGLFNWTEPLLHPRLPEMVRIVHSFGVRCDLSSNLNSIKGLEAVLAEHPAAFRISCSGFTQENYGYTHRGGDIERVKTNMRTLMEMRDRVGAPTVVHMLYHRYRDNLKDELLMKGFCDSLGIHFVPVWALLQPLEKVLAIVDEDPAMADVTPEDRELVRRLLVPLPEALQAARRHSGATCRMQEEEITIDCKGNVMLCCVVYDAQKYGLGKYLDLPVEAIQEMKYTSTMCTRCISRGAHAYFSMKVPELIELAVKNAASVREQEYLTQNPALIL